MSGFGPPPGPPVEASDPAGSSWSAGPADRLVGTARRRPPAYLPPGGLTTSAPAYGSSRDAVVRGPQRALLTTSHKPGIISLRPMSLGDLVDGAVKHIRRNPGPVLGASLVVLTVSAVPALLLAAAGSRGSWYSDIGAQAILDRGAFFALVLLLGVAFASVVLSGAMAYSVGEAALGRRPALAEIATAVRPRLLALLGLAALLTLAVGVPVLLLVLLLALAAGTGSLLAGVLVGLVGGLVVTAWSVLLTARFSLAGAAVALERRGPTAALTRSWALTHGAFWRCLLRTLVVGMLGTLVFWVVQLPLVVLSSVAVGIVSVSPSGESLVSSLGLAVATLLSAAVVVPFIAGATALLYVDQRMRTEGFDLVLQRAARRSPGGPG